MLSKMEMEDGRKGEEAKENGMDQQDLEAVQARVRQLEATVVELDNAAQTFKLVAEKQTAEINAKELLLARKTEYVDELLEQIQALTSKLDTASATTQKLESKSQEMNIRVDKLREQVKKDDENFAVVCAALDTRDELLAKKKGDLAAATEIEEQLRKEVDKYKAMTRRLEKKVKDLQPEKVDACLSPRSFQENQLIRLRDDAIEAKTREVWLLSGQNDQLRVQLDDLEVVLEQLQQTLISKENDLVERQRKIENLEATIDALQLSRSQAEGCKKAMEIATRQNEKLLQALEAQERHTEELQARFNDCQHECEQLRSSHRTQIARTAENEVELLHQSKQVAEQTLAVKALEEKLCQERQLFQRERSSSHLNYQLERERAQSELVMRRNKQYDLTLKLQDVEARLYEAIDRRESAEEQLMATTCRMRELERVLLDSLEWKKKLESEMAQQKEGALEANEKHNKRLAKAKDEIIGLQRQTEEMKEAMAKRLGFEQEQERQYHETKQLLSTTEALALEQKERLHGFMRDIKRDAQVRAAIEQEKSILVSQLEDLRQETGNTLREYVEYKKHAQDKRQQLAEKFTKLTSNYHAVQNAKSKLVCKYADAFGQAIAASLASGTHWPTSDCLTMRECWLVDEDLRPLFEMLDTEGRGLERLDLRSNRLTCEGMSRLIGFVKKLIQELTGTTGSSVNGIREIDLRQNCISLDGIRRVAKALESLIPSKSSSNNNNTSAAGVKRVTVADNGRIEVFGAAENRCGSVYSKAQDTTLPAPILVIDISSNGDEDWLVAESRRYRAQHRQRGKDLKGIHGSTSSNNNASKLHGDALASSRNKSLEGIYNLNLVSALMGQDTFESSHSPKKGATRCKSISSDNSMRLVSPQSSRLCSMATVLTPRGSEPLPCERRAESETSTSTHQLPLAGDRTRDNGTSPRLAPSVSLPRLPG